MNVVDARQGGRWEITSRVDGSLAGTDVAIVDIGLHGVQITHATPVRLGAMGRLSMVVPGRPERVSFYGYVVWSRIASAATSDGDRRYRSGVRLDDPDDQLESIIRHLVDISAARPEKDSLEQKRKALAAREASKRQPGMKFFGGNAPRIPNDVILLVRQTRDRLNANPTENVKWLNRAKYSLDEAGALINHRDDVLAVWEYLERSVQLDIIARILDD